jgi:peptide/nickel transport system ATP-binding protein/oligopeptide transport system ATP-binding protein
MYLGRIVEIGEAEALMEAPKHPYTQALLSALPRPVADGKRERIILSGEVPDPAHPPAGCAFHTRCPRAFERCSSERPALAPRADGDTIRTTACHLYPTA